MKIAISLSGGGIRATIFHLGVFKYLADRGLLGSVAHVSSVSGASLCMALIFSHNNNKWPDDKDFLERELPEIEETILKNDLECGAILNLLVSITSNKAGLVAKTMRKKWGVTGSLRDLPDSPVWEINATTFETAKDFRYSKAKMGDYILGYIEHPDFPIAEAAASSAGFPIAIGPLKVDTQQYHFPNLDTNEELKKLDRYLYLWDGGVYDNLGLEALFANGALKGGSDFLIVSNAGAAAKITDRKGGVSSALNIRRLLDIAMDQVFSLRSREAFNSVIKGNQGIYVNIGNSAEKITTEAKADEETKKRLTAECMTAKEAQSVHDYKTTLLSPSKADYDLILRQGYENTKCCWECYIK
jgi:NTE family protein